MSRREALKSGRKSALGQEGVEAGCGENLKRGREAGQFKSQVAGVRGSPSFLLLQSGRGCACVGVGGRGLELPWKPPWCLSLSGASPGVQAASRSLPRPEPGSRRQGTRGAGLPGSYVASPVYAPHRLYPLCPHSQQQERKTLFGAKSCQPWSRRSPPQAPKHVGSQPGTLSCHTPDFAKVAM